MPAWVRDELGKAESQDWAQGVLKMLAEVNRYFGLGESPRETALRRWWDVLAMQVVIRSVIPRGTQAMPVIVVG